MNTEQKAAKNIFPCNVCYLQPQFIIILEFLYYYIFRITVCNTFRNKFEKYMSVDSSSLRTFESAVVL